jgi:hypothetical protein
MSERKQRILLGWALVFLTIYGLSLMFLFRMLPPPSATWTAGRIAEFYTQHRTSIRLGAVVASWTSGFEVPLVIVLGIQLARHEEGVPVWAIASVCAGTVTSMFLVLPPIFWGVAAFTPQRASEITATMHELGVLTLVTTTQYFIFMFVAVIVICLTPNSVVHSPFPRWFGYFTAWATVMFEVGPVAFLTRTGPFSWNGLLVFWAPFSIFGLWIILLAGLFFKSLAQQSMDSADVVPPAVASE